jgi:hypothetical protein
VKLYLDGVGLLGPGLPHWAAGREILAGRQPYEPAAVALVPTDLLPVAERRRMTDTVKLAIAIASEAMAAAGADPRQTPSVFASSGGDGKTIEAILACLAAPEREVSPTRFHNSVHNAPSGYWSIATQSGATTTSICAYDFSFGAGLLEAASQAVAEETTVLLASYDLPYPPALHGVRPIEGIFGAGFVLSPRQSARSLAALSVGLTRDARAETVMARPDLEVLRAGNPTARALPLLAALACGVSREIVLRHVAGNTLVIGIEPFADPAGAAADAR